MDGVGSKKIRWSDSELMGRNAVYVVDDDGEDDDRERERWE